MWWWAATAWGCASCACGDPTLAPFGVERPTAGRVRLGLEVAHRAEIGASATRWEDQGGLQLGWAPGDRWMLAAAWPVVWRGQTLANGGRDEGVGLGDPSIAARAVVWRDGPAPRHAVTVAWTQALALAPAVRYPDGTVAVDEAQPGRGEWAGSPAVTWSFVDGRFSTWVTAGARGVPPVQHVPAAVTGLGSAGLQVQPSTRVAARVGVDGRVGDASSAAMLVPGLLWSVATDWTLLARGGLHLAHAGPWRDGASFGLQLAVDL
jgi:hypothetical protein